MIKSFLSSLFSKKKIRKNHNYLSIEDKKNLVTDININKMTVREVANKYSISEQTVRNHYKKAMGNRNA